MSQEIQSLKELYLKTVRDTLTGYTYKDSKPLPFYPLRRFLNWLFPNLLIGVKNKQVNESRLEWWSTALTMIGNQHLDNFRYCIESAVKDGVEGDIVECGVFRGGACIYAAAILAANNWNRNIYVCDSFRGLPPPEKAQDKGSRWHKLNDFLAVSIEQVKDNFRRFHLDGDNIRFVEGFFEHSLKKISCDKIAVLRCDGDMYQSTMDILENLYHKVNIGGYIIIDDWDVPECRRAVEDYLRQRNLEVSLMPFGTNARYWKKLAQTSKTIAPHSQMVSMEHV